MAVTAPRLTPIAACLNGPVRFGRGVSGLESRAERRLARGSSRVQTRALLILGCHPSIFGGVKILPASRTWPSGGCGCWLAGLGAACAQAEEARAAGDRRPRSCCQL